jgi:hypothetical protein
MSLDKKVDRVARAPGENRNLMTFPIQQCCSNLGGGVWGGGGGHSHYLRYFALRDQQLSGYGGVDGNGCSVSTGQKQDLMLPLTSSNKTFIDLISEERQNVLIPWASVL